MRSSLGRKLIGLAVVAIWPLVAAAQYPSEVVGFNGPPIDDPATSQEMFRQPQFSGTTSSYIVANVADYDNNSAYRAAGLQTEGAAALEVSFYWVDEADPSAWVRLTTFDGPERPNPTLDTRGKVRFNVTNRSELFEGEIGLCLGIRETGAVDVPQLGDGGTSGAIEWVGTDPTVLGITAGPDGIVDTGAIGDDVQEYPVGYDIIANGLHPDTDVISPGGNGVIDTVPTPDDQYRIGYFLGGPNGDTRIPIPAITLPPRPLYYELEWDLTTGQGMIDGTPFNFAVTGFTGNGILDATGDRGVLEHVAITNLAGDPATFINFAIDELQFEATVPDPTPPPTIQAPVVETDTQVYVNCIAEATEAELFINGESWNVVEPVDSVATFNVGGALEIGDILTATQTANDVVSGLSSPVVVYAEGTALAENFDTYMSQEELLELWALDVPSDPRQVRLSTGSASSCDNLVVSDYITAPSVARLYYSLGAIDGSDAEPLVVTYRFKHSDNDPNARARFELASSLSRAYGALGFAFTNGVDDPQFGEQYTTMTNSPTPVIEGYQSDYFYYDYALTGIPREAGVWHKMQIVVRSEFVDFYIDDVLANPVDPVSGLPIWPDGVPRVPDTPPFQFIIIGLGYSNNGPAMMYDDVSVTVGDTPIPFGDPNPIESPTVNGPLFPGITEVLVTDIDPTASAVQVFADRVPLLDPPDPGPFTEGQKLITVPALIDGEAIGATQTVGGIESCLSGMVTVSIPAPTVEAILVPGEISVSVSNIEEGLASAVRVYRDLGQGELVELGSVANPTEDPVEVAVEPLPEGYVVVATQTIGGVEGPPSAGVTVATPGTIGGWIETSSLPHGITDHQLVYLNKFVYSIGGRTGSGSGNPTTTANDFVYYAPVNLDGSIGAWASTTPLPQGLATAGAAAYNGRIYVWGGWTTNYPTVNTCYYATQNPEDGTLGPWTTSAVTIPDNTDVDPPGIQMDAMGRGDLIYGNTLYLINGEWDSGVAYGNTGHCYYSAITGGGDFGPWITTTPTPVPAEGGSWFHGQAVIEGKTETYIYRVAGNYRGTTESDMWMNTIQPDGSLGDWVQDPQSLPDGGRYEMACATADNTFIMVICGLYGGTPQNTVFYTEVDPETGALGEWIPGPDYPETVCRNAAVSYYANGRNYVLVASGGPYSGIEGNRTPRCFYTAINVDYNDIVDFAQFQACYDPEFAATPECTELFDFNGDGYVDFYDYERFARRFGGP